MEKSRMCGQFSAFLTTALRVPIHVQGSCINEALSLTFCGDNSVKYYCPHAYYIIYLLQSLIQKLWNQTEKRFNL